MKNFKFLIFGLLLLNLSLFTACDDDEETMVEPDPMDIVDTAIATDDLSSLVAALEEADLVTTLRATGPFTVFAPTNAAFQALLDSNDDWNTLEDIDDATLENVLKFHVLAADIKAADLTNSYVTALATGPNDEQIVLQVDVTDGVKFNGSTEPTTTDIATTNGTVHIVNEVMLPPTVVDLALNNPNFSTLVAALTRSDLTTDYVATLSASTGTFTVFAPNNAAFQALLDSNDDWSSLDDIPLETLEAVLNYHVVSGGNVQSDELSNEQELMTLGGMLTVDLTDGAKLKTTSDQTVNIGLTDVQGANGVIHEIESVLLP